MPPAPEPVRLERLPRFAWAIIPIVALSVLYTVIQVARVRPYLWPAGTGATLAGDPTAHLPLKARPPNVVRDFLSAPQITRVAPGSAADAAGIVAGHRLRAVHRADGSRRVTFDGRLSTDAGRVEVWRELYRAGVSGAVNWEVEAQDGATRRLLLAGRRPLVQTPMGGRDVTSE